MKKSRIIISIVIIVLIMISIYYIIDINSYTKNIVYTYEPKKAIEYSYKYINNRNPEYPIFENNCITYISQCLVAGGMEMDNTSFNKINKTRVVRTSKQWYSYSYEIDKNKPIYYYVSSSFSNITDFIKYWSKVRKVPTDTIDNTKESIKILLNNVNEGDVIILHGKLIHSAIVVKKDEENLYYNSNTNDRNEYPLSYVLKDEYQKITYLKFTK